jgi:predicted nucleic acid-binding protein
LKRVILDASVAAKWFVPPPAEPDREEALKLLRGYNDGKLDIIVPDIFWAEIANFLWKAARSGRCTPAEARASLAAGIEYNFKTVPSISLLRGAFDIAAFHDRAIYDCLYVALTEQADADLITVDERLASALAVRHRVKLLSAI